MPDGKRRNTGRKYGGDGAAVLQAVENSRAELDLIVFPEYCYYTPVDKDDARRIAIDVSRPHPFIDRMKELAREYHVNLIPGSFAAVAKDGKVSNHSIMLNREGEEIGFYDKIHLFDAAGYKESSYVEAGSRLCLVDFDFGKVGFEVCYDLRFPEQARTMVLQGPTSSSYPPSSRRVSPCRRVPMTGICW